MRILILGDSLPFPRPTRGQPLKLTWPSLLKDRLPQIDAYLRAHPRFTIIDVLKELGFFAESLADFDAVIVQVGIVDCAPRPYPHLIAKLIEVCVSMPTFRKIEGFTHRRLLWCYRRPWVEEAEFVSAAQHLVEMVFSCNPRLKVIFITVAPPSRTIVELLPGIELAAGRYNAALSKIINKLAPTYGCRLLDPFTGADQLMFTIEDGHHLSGYGHKLIADSLVPALAPS